MNDDLLKGKWAEIKSELLRVWSQLSNDELEETQGDLASIGGLIQQRYGLARENVQQRLSDVIAGFRRKLKEDGLTDETESSARAEREEVHGSLRDQYRQF